MIPITLLRMRGGSKINCIKSLRYGSSLDLRLAKEVCESLPREVLIDPNSMPDIEQHFEIAQSNGEEAKKLQARWDALPEHRKTALISYLAAINML